MRFILKHWFLFSLLLLSILCYSSVLLSPAIFWPVVFFSYAIPGILVINLIVLIIFAIKRSTLFVIPFIALVLGFPFIQMSFSFRGKLSKKESAITVLSFNAKLFRQYKTYEAFSFDMIKWVVDDSSKIKCIQEYCTNTSWDKIDVTLKLKTRGYNVYAHKSKIKNSIHDLGMATFSTYPIIKAGVVWGDSASLNGTLFTDLDLGNDTLRVYNVHLASMGIKLSEFKQKEGYTGKIKRLISKLKNGASKRSNQIDKLIEHTSHSPHPYIVCGDFNETPYSYNYFRLKSSFDNAFEKAGNGFGFSLNSLLFFLRIDHQFYSAGIKPVSYRVDRSMHISDHFPTRGDYYLEQ